MVSARRTNCREAKGNEDGPVEIEFNNVAQIILAVLLGVAAILRALTGFLPVWRAKHRMGEAPKLNGRITAIPPRLMH